MVLQERGQEHASTALVNAAIIAFKPQCEAETYYFTHNVTQYAYDITSIHVIHLTCEMVVNPTESTDPQPCMQ